MNLTAYINDSIAELRHVRWPTRRQAVRLSAITIGFTAVVSMAFGIIDFLLNKAVAFLLSLTF